MKIFIFVDGNQSVIDENREMTANQKMIKNSGVTENRRCGHSSRVVSTVAFYYKNYLSPVRNLTATPRYLTVTRIIDNKIPVGLRFESVRCAFRCCQMLLARKNIEKSKILQVSLLEGVVRNSR